MKKYLNTFWQKLLMPLTVGAMVLLATPISANLGSSARSQFRRGHRDGRAGGGYCSTWAPLFCAGAVAGLNIPLVALAPTLVILLCAAVLLRRMRW